MTQLTVGGVAFSDDRSTSRDMNDGGYATWLLPLLSAVLAEIGDIDSAVLLAQSAAALAASTAAGWTATSTTSQSIGIGTKAITVQPGKQFVEGTPVLMMRTSARLTHRMQCDVSSYNSVTGALVLQSVNAIGSGTYTDWTIALSGLQGADATIPTQVGHATKVLGTDGLVTGWVNAIEDGYDEFNSSGTWTKRARAKWVLVELVGGGGSGGVASGNGGNSYARGGWPGQWRYKLFRASDLASTETVTIPAAAAAVSRVGNGGTGSVTGNNGGDTVFGAHLTAKGGLGGQVIAAGATTVPWVGIDAVKGGGMGGSVGDNLILAAPTTSEEAGSGGAAVTTNVASASITATSGTAPGGGGGGAACSNTAGTGTLTSGAGTVGRARVWQW